MHESVLLEEDLLGERPGKHSNMTFQINFIRMLNIITGLQAIRISHSYTLPNLWFGDLPWLFFYREACWNILQCLEYIHKCWSLQVLNIQLYRQRYNLRHAKNLSKKQTNEDEAPPPFARIKVCFWQSWKNPLPAIFIFRKHPKCENMVICIWIIINSPVVKIRPKKHIWSKL